MYDVDHDDLPEAVQRARAILERTAPTQEELDEQEERRRANRLERIMNPPPPPPVPIIRRVQENALIETDLRTRLRSDKRPATRGYVVRQIGSFSDALVDRSLGPMIARVIGLKARVEALEAAAKPRVRVRAGGERWPTAE